MFFPTQIMPIVVQVKVQWEGTMSLQKCNSIIEE